MPNTAVTIDCHPVGQFLDSIGVATHLRYLDTAYGDYENIIKPKLGELGVRYIRDGGKSNELFARVVDLHNSFGIKSVLVCDPRDGIYRENIVNDVMLKCLPAIDAVESVNEWDVNRHLQYAWNIYPNAARYYTNDVIENYTQDVRTRYIPMVAPSIAIPEFSGELGYVKSCDYGNLHYYPGGHFPGKDLDQRFIDNARLIVGNKPLYCTETGYHTGHLWAGDGHLGVSELAQAKYIPRLLCELFKRGVKRSFIYELIDERQDNPTNKENNFGLLRFDGSEKPVFTYLKRLIGKLEVLQGWVTSDQIVLTVSQEAENIKMLGLTGGYDMQQILIWQDVVSYDLPNNKDVVTPVKNLTLYRSGLSGFQYYDPLTGLSFSSGGGNEGSISNITIPIPDYPVVVSLF